MAHSVKIIYVIFGVIQIVSLSSVEQNENTINEEIVGLMPPGLIATKLRNDAIQEHLRTMARANLISHHHPHMQLVPIFRDADEDNNFETNSLDSNAMRASAMSQDQTINPNMVRASTNENPTMNQAIMNDKPQVFRASTTMTNIDPTIVQNTMNDRPQMFRAMEIEDPTMIQTVINDKPQTFRAMTNADSTMIPTSMNQEPQMFRAMTNGDSTVVQTTSNGKPQMFRPMTNEESTMVRAAMDNNPQMFRDMTNEDRELVQAMLNDNPQMFHAVSNNDPITVQAMQDNAPQLLRVSTNGDTQKLRESSNSNQQILTANNGMILTLPNDSNMFRETENGNPQTFRVMTTDDQGMMMQSNGNSNFFRVATNDDSQKLSSTNGDQQLLKANHGMVMILPNDSKMFRGSENESPQVVHVMENPQSFRVAPTDDHGMIHAVTDDNMQLFRAFNDDDYFDMNDNGIAFMEQLPDDFLNFQAINDENEFRTPSTVMLISTPNENLQNGFRQVQNPITQGTNISKMKLASENEKIVNSQSMIENRSSDDTTLANQTETSPGKGTRPTLSITGTLTDLQKAINRTLSKPEEARAANSDDSGQSNFKHTSMYCITLNDKDLPQININSQRLAPTEDISPNLDSNNASNHILPDQQRSQTFITDADLVIPLDNNNIDDSVNSKQFSENPIQHTVTPIRILSPQVHQQPEIKHIPHVTPIHVISHGNNFGNQDYNRNAEGRHIIKNNFVSTEFISPTSSINQFGTSFHRGFPSSQTFSQSSASASSFQNGGGFHRFIPSTSGSSASAFAQSSGVSHQPFFNGFRSNNDDNHPINMENDQNIRKSGFGVQPTIKAFRLVGMDDPNHQDNGVTSPSVFHGPSTTHRLKKRSVTQNITSNSLIPIIQGIEDLFGDQNGTNSFMEPLKEVENFLEKHTINEKIQFEKDKNGEPIIKTEFSTNFNPQELFTEFEEELPKINRTKRTLALIHLLAKPSPLNNDLLGRSATPTEQNLPPIIHLRNALGSAGRAAINVVETPLLGFILPHSVINEPLGDSQNPNLRERLTENRQKTMEHYQNTIQSLGSAVQAHRQRNFERQNNFPVDTTEVRDLTTDSQMDQSESTQESVIEDVPQRTHMIIRPIGRSWARMGFPATRRVFFVAEPFNPSQISDQPELKSANSISFNTPQNTPQITIRKPNKKFKKVIHRQPTKFEPSRGKNVVVGSNFEGNGTAIDSSAQNLTSQSDLNLTEIPEANLTSSNSDAIRNDNSTQTNVMATSNSRKSDVLEEENNLITISQCKEMQQNGEIKVKRDENDVNDNNNDTDSLGTPNFTESMKKPFGGFATNEEINNYISDMNID